MIDTFGLLCDLGKEVGGTVTSAMMYDTGYMVVEGRTYDGKKFTLTMMIKEEEKDA